MCKHDDDMMDRDDDYESAWENDDKGKFVFSCEKNGDITSRTIMKILEHFLGMMMKITSGIMKE